MPDNIQWIKISTGLFDDEKIKLIAKLPDADTIIIIWLYLLILAGKVNDREGQKSDKQIAEETGKTIAEIRVGLFRLKKSKKVEKWNGVWGLLSNEQE